MFYGPEELSSSPVSTARKARIGGDDGGKARQPLTLRKPWPVKRAL